MLSAVSFLIQRACEQVKEFLSTIMLPAASSDHTQSSQSTQASMDTTQATGTASGTSQKVILFAHHKSVMNLLQIMLEDHFQVPKKDSPGAPPNSHVLYFRTHDPEKPWRATILLPHIKLQCCTSCTHAHREFEGKSIYINMHIICIGRCACRCYSAAVCAN